MKKGNIILIVIALFITLLVGGYFYLTIDATKKADKLMKKIENYHIPDVELVTGKYIDFSKDKNIFTKDNIKEGIIYIDQNISVQIVSNIKIGLFYCTFNEGAKCNIFNKKDTNVVTLKEYEEYSINEAVTLKDNTKWHVIHNSDKYSQYVILLRDERVDYNNDGFTVDTGMVEDPDRIPFDTNGNKKYDITAVGNIGNYIENTYKKSLTSLNNVYQVRLLTTLEYEALSEAIAFDELTEQQVLDMMAAEDEVLDSIGWMYEYPRPVQKLKDIKITDEQRSKLMPHWLHNSMSGNYWILQENGKPCTVVWNGNGYSNAKPTTGYSLKPVMIIDKANIK